MRKGADKLKLAMTAKQQGRLDGFFTVQSKPEGSDSKKRKVRPTAPSAPGLMLTSACLRAHTG